jgi:hypothetical protein
VAARRAYKTCIKEKKREYELRCQVALLETYFGTEQKDFWRVLFADRRPSPALADVDAWTAYFRGLLGVAPQPVALAPSDVALKQQLYAAAPKGDMDAMSVLNDPVSVEEARQCMALATGRAPDMQGHTGEMLRLAASDDPVLRDGTPVCPPAIACAQWLLHSMLTNACVPGPLCTSKLVPVPKAATQAALLDRDMYRGISVPQLFARSLDRFMNKRLESVVSRLTLRSPTQCGFRPGHGTLDAIFTLQHLVHSAQHHGRMLYVVFVDFKKAFDRVRRDLLLERCRELGIHGEFLALLVKLYDRVLCRVAVGGAQGEPIDTATGTKQGSELSPLLFGLFIELLHDMIKLQLPGAGPILGNLRVPDIMYADDVTLVSSDPVEVQQLLDVLSVFCRIFDMEVNLAPHKTCVVVFRRPALACLVASACCIAAVRLPGSPSTSTWVSRFTRPVDWLGQLTR